MKRIFKIIAENSNALLTFITIIALILMINTSMDSGRRANAVLINAVEIYMSLNREDGINNTQFHQMIKSLDGAYTGPEGKRAIELLREMEADLTLKEFKSLLQEFITQYQLMLEERVYIFNTLFFFLAAGIIIQFILILITARRQEITSSRLENSEEILKLLNTEREKERLRISSHLHDSVLQEIGSLLLTKEMQECDYSSKAMRKISEDLRNLTYSISPLHLSTAGFSDTLSDYLKDFEAETGIKTSYIISGFNNDLISKDEQLILFRIAQEALNNVKKHARAENVTIRIVTSYPYLIIRIKDDGIGMKDLTFIKHSNRSQHLGMRLMHEQTKSMGAQLSGKSTKGEGTEIIIKYPINKRKNT